MPFDVLSVRAADDMERGAGMYPVPGDATSPIAYEQLDGKDIERLHATAVSSRVDLGSTTRDLIHVRKVRADVLITGQRVALACEKYDKGGGWVGSPSLMVAANAVSKARASRRRRGNVLVGHVRYQWLASVGYLSRGGLLKLEIVRLGLVDGSVEPQRPIILQLELPTNISASKVAGHIVERAATFWLMHGVPEEHAAAFAAASQNAPTEKPSGGDKWLTYHLPFFLPALARTALVAESELPSTTRGERL
jgi:hypothetical protein